MPFLSSLEHSAFGTWVREAPTIWAYATILFLHTVGLGFVVGVNVAIDLRILGVARQIPLAPMRRLFPWMWAGFIVNALSGIALLIADATTKLANPVFLVKMAFITHGVVEAQAVRRSDGARAVPRAVACPTRGDRVAHPVDRRDDSWSIDGLSRP